MTPQAQAEICRVASLKRVEKNCTALARIAQAMRLSPEITPLRMPKGRVLLSEIGKDLHESSAYANQAKL